MSLHAPNDDLRNHIMPINRRYNLTQLMEARREYVEATNRRITFEYALMQGFNDSPEHARQLAQLIKGILCHVNLIPLKSSRWPRMDIADQAAGALVPRGVGQA